MGKTFHLWTKYKYICNIAFILILLNFKIAMFITLSINNLSD